MEYVLAFVIIIFDSDNRVDLELDYQFSSYKDCERFALNKSREIILEKYTGFGYDKVIPACKQIDRYTALKIDAANGI